MQTILRTNPTEKISNATASCSSLLSSVVLWIIITLFVCDRFLIVVRPLQFVRIRGLITEDQEPLGEKLERLSGLSHGPDYLFLGSSLPMSACVGSDWELSGRPDWTIPFCERYIGTKYFDKVSSARFGKNLKGFDLAMPASMVSDDYVILGEALKIGARPKEVILAVAPRDFIDNTASPVNASRYYKFISDRRKPFEISSSNSIEQNVSELCSRVWRFFKVRSDYRRTVEFVVCSFFGRASSFSNALEGKSFERDRLQDVQIAWGSESIRDAEPAADIADSHDISVYKRRYLPFNRPRLAEELQYLARLFDLCKKNGIRVTVVEMPLHPQNLDLLSQSERESVYGSVSSVCRNSGVRHIDFDRNLFAPKDFSDSVHLRSRPSLKFMDLLVNRLSAPKE